MLITCLVISCYLLLGIYGDSYYNTPQLDDQFEQFRVTRTIPKEGTVTDHGDLQDAVDLSSYSVAFQFKGKGNALLLFQEDETNETANVFLVEIGGGNSFRRVAIYNSKTTESTPGGQTSISFITNEEEFRPFWVRWFRTSVYLGRGLVVGESQIFSTAHIVMFAVCALSISTSSTNDGMWHFYSELTSIVAPSVMSTCKGGRSSVAISTAASKQNMSTPSTLTKSRFWETTSTSKVESSTTSKRNSLMTLSLRVSTTKGTATEPLSLEADISLWLFSTPVTTSAPCCTLSPTVGSASHRCLQSHTGSIISSTFSIYSIFLIYSLPLILVL